MPAMTDMDCCPSENPDCPDTEKPDLGCLADAGCLARCTFLQPALAGPVIAYSATFANLDIAVARSTGLPSQRGYPPDRPPKLTLHV